MMRIHRFAFAVLATLAVGAGCGPANDDGSLSVGTDAGGRPEAASSSGASSGSSSGAGSGSSSGAGPGSSSGVSSSSGSSSGASSSSGSGGSSSGGSNPCAVSPVSPNASQQAKNLLCYLYSIKGNHVLSGQQEANWNASPTDIAWYGSNIGKYPAILGSDFLYRGSASCSEVTPSTMRAIDYWNAGGIAIFRYHMGMPNAGTTCADDCYDNGANCAEPTVAPTAAFFTNVMTAGTPENASLNAKLDYVAVQIAAMEAANVPVLLAIYHETQANGWFWWAESDSGPTFVDLWTYTFDYLTKTKGLTNIVWLMPFSGSPSSAYYPGKALVDIGGPDEYTQPSNLLTFNASSNYGPATTVFGGAMPIALHETGTAVQPSTMFPTTAPWVLFNVWATYENTAISGFMFNTVASMQAVYASSFTITRDEIPSLK